MPQYILATCDVCGKRFLIKHTLSCPKGGLVLAHHDDAAKESDAIGAWDLVPSANTYKPIINSRTIQGGEDQGQSAAEWWNSQRRSGNCRRIPMG